VVEIAVIAAVLAVTALVRDRVSGWPLTGPMIFVVAGMTLGPDGVELFEVRLDNESISLVAELTLALLLFSDATRINTVQLRRSFALPARLLAIGLPLTIGLGTLMTAMLLTDLTWSEAALVAAILAPTDAALGHAVVSDTRVPVLVRQSLNVESGLNDGLVVPAVALFAIVAAGDEIEGAGSLIREALVEIGLGVALGVATGSIIGFACNWVADRQWTDADGLRLVTFGGAVAGFGASVAAGGNGFIAAFVAGLVVHVVAEERAVHQSELAEDIGQVGAAATFFIFGALMVIPALDVASWPVVACALGTLTVGRIVPVGIALLGAGLKAPTKLFIGWFGPRGLASMLFALLFVAERGDEVDNLFAVVSLVVFASVMLHGITAAPGAKRYAEWFDQHQSHEMMESEPMVELPLRGRRRGNTD